VWTYSGIEDVSGLSLSNYTADLISVNASTGDIRVSASKKVGNYQIKVVGTLPDLTVKFEIFKINILKQPVYSYFTPTYNFYLEVPASNRFQYSLPMLLDLYDEHVLHLTTLPPFTTFNNPVYTFIPNSRNDVGLTIVKGRIPALSILFILRVNVTNMAPRFIYGRIPDLNLPLVRENMRFELPEVFDREGQSVKIVATEVDKRGLPEFVKFSERERVFKFDST